jgi:putative ABC transport system ATP-binding protein
VGARILVIADEPTASLDTATARFLVELLASVTSTGTAVLMTTHDSRLATFADRIVLLRDGKQVNPAAAPSTIVTPS